jgi:hypothetical protein
MGLSLGVGGDGRPATSVAATAVWPEVHDTGEMLPRASGAGAVPDPDEEELEELIWSMEKYVGRLARLRLRRRALALFEVVLVGVMVAVCGRAGSASGTYAGIGGSSSSYSSVSSSCMKWRNATESPGALWGRAQTRDDEEEAVRQWRAGRWGLLVLEGWRA